MDESSSTRLLYNFPSQKGIIRDLLEPFFV